jgi:hypothetical protein
VERVPLGSSVGGTPTEAVETTALPGIVTLHAFEQDLILSPRIGVGDGAVGNCRQFFLRSSVCSLLKICFSGTGEAMKLKGEQEQMEKTEKKL